MRISMGNQSLVWCTAAGSRPRSMRAIAFGVRRFCRQSSTSQGATRARLPGTRWCMRDATRAVQFQSNQRRARDRKDL